jgi:hypothetical protein
MQLVIRKIPWPWRSALSICSDIDGCSFDDFQSIHTFLNTDKSTEMGPGLQLPLADSFWFYDHPDAPDRAFAWFDGFCNRESEHAEKIRDAIQAGWIDTLHSWGNFSTVGGFSRILAEQAAEAMTRNGLQVPVWVNHGDDGNSQNIGIPAGWDGDVPVIGGTPNPAYHADIMRAVGVHFLHTLETDVSPVIGQERPCGLTEAWWRSPYAETLVQKLKEPVKSGLTLANKAWQGLTGKPLNRWDAFIGDNALLWPTSLRDGADIIRFRRMGSGRRDWCDDLPWLLRPAVLDRLEQSGGASILYVHWGDRKQRDGGPPFNRDIADRFRDLAQRREAGSVWVDSTSRILRYVTMAKYLQGTMQWEVETGTLRVTASFPDRITAICSLEECTAMLTLVVPNEMKPRRLLWNDREIRFQINPPDAKDVRTVTLL